MSRYTSEHGELHTEDLTAAGRARRAPLDERPAIAADADATPGVGGAEVGTSLPRPGDRAPSVQPIGSGPGAGGWAELLGDTAALGARWDAVQAGFVDEPRRAVEEADALVAQVVQRLAEGFAAERAQLEAQWSQGSQVSTEDLRVALRRYRSFFNRLLLRPEGGTV